MIGLVNLNLVVAKRSRRFRNARIAPVSMRPCGLSSMPACNPCAHCGLGVLCQIRRTLDGAGALQGCFAHTSLLFLRGTGLAAGLLEPALYDFLKEIRNTLLFRPGSLLQLALETRRETPTIDLGLHAPQCSADCGALSPNSLGRLGGDREEAEADLTARVAESPA